MKQKIRKKIISLAAVLLAINFIFFLAAPALASDVNDLWGGSDKKDYIKVNSGLPVGTEDGNIYLIITQVIKFVLGFLGILAVIIILYAGFKWMTSGGSEDKVGDAKKMLIAGLIGLVIILAAYILANFAITNIFNAVNGQ
jgi:hypothetical protein